MWNWNSSDVSQFGVFNLKKKKKGWERKQVLRERASLISIWMFSSTLKLARGMRLYSALWSIVLIKSWKRKMNQACCWSLARQETLWFITNITENIWSSLTLTAGILELGWMNFLRFSTDRTNSKDLNFPYTYCSSSATIPPFQGAPKKLRSIWDKTSH